MSGLPEVKNTPDNVYENGLQTAEKSGVGWMYLSCFKDCYLSQKAATKIH